MAFDLKSATPDTTFPSGGFLFGADSQAATNPSIYSDTAYRDYILGLANTWTATQALSVNGAVSAPVITGTGTWYSGGSATTTKPAWLIEPTGATSTAWSTAGTGLGINAAASFNGNLIDAQNNGQSIFNVRVTSTNPPGTGDRIVCYLSSSATRGAWAPAWVAGSPASAPATDGTCGLTSNGLRMRGDTGTVEWGNGTDWQVTDVKLYRGAANTLALANSTNAQTFLVYYTTDSATSPTNYQRMALSGDADDVTITAQTGGTGADDINVSLVPAGAGLVKFGTHAAVGAETVTGYITIKDSGGTDRKIAVIS